MTRYNGSLTLTLLTMLAAAPAISRAEQRLQELRDISTAAEQAVTARGAGVQALADPPDARLRLVACERPLQATVPAAAKGPRISVRVACTSATPWSVLLPVKVETDTQVVVARRALVPGTLIAADDVAAVRRRIPGFADCCAQDTQAVLGQRVRRPIAADAAVTLDSLEAPPLVRRGEMVTVIAGAPGFEVRSSGVALADARQGDAVRIRHTTSLRIIQARADSKGVVRADQGP